MHKSEPDFKLTNMVMDDLMRSAGADHLTAPAPPNYGGAVKKTCVKAVAM